MYVRACTSYESTSADQLTSYPILLRFPQYYLQHIMQQTHTTFVPLIIQVTPVSKQPAGRSPNGNSRQEETKEDGSWHPQALSEITLMMLQPEQHGNGSHNHSAAAASASPPAPSAANTASPNAAAESVAVSAPSNPSSSPPADSTAHAARAAAQPRAPANTNEVELTSLQHAEHAQQGQDDSPSADSSAPAPHQDSLTIRAKFERQLVVHEQGVYEMEELFGLYDEQPECIICFTDIKDVILLPCKHVCICQSCHQSVATWSELPHYCMGRSALR